MGMGLTERHWFENEDVPENYEWALEDAVYNSRTNEKQEAVEPVVDIDTWKCGNCGHTLERQELLGDNVLFHEQYNYCPECGKKVKWNILSVLCGQNSAIINAFNPETIAFRNKVIELQKNCPMVEWEQDMGATVPYCKLDNTLCNGQCSFRTGGEVNDKAGNTRHV